MTELTRRRFLESSLFAGATSMMASRLAFASAPATFVYHDVGAAGAAGWNVAHLDLGAHAGETIAVISLKFLGGGGPGYQI